MAMGNSSLCSVYKLCIYPLLIYLLQQCVDWFQSASRHEADSIR